MVRLTIASGLVGSSVGLTTCISANTPVKNLDLMVDSMPDSLFPPVVGLSAADLTRTAGEANGGFRFRTRAGQTTLPGHVWIGIHLTLNLNLNLTLVLALEKTDGMSVPV